MNINISGTPEEMRQFLCQSAGGAMAREHAEATAGLTLPASTAYSELSEQVRAAGRTNAQTAQKVQTMLNVQNHVLGPANFDIENMRKLIIHDVKWYQFGKLISPHGLEGVQLSFRAFAATFKFIKLRSILAIGQDDYLAYSYELVARQISDFMGKPATNDIISLHGIAISRHAGGLITEYHDSWEIPGIAPRLDMMGPQS